MCCDTAIGGDADPGIEQARVDRRARRGAASPLGERERLESGRAEADDECAGAFEEFAARLLSDVLERGAGKARRAKFSLRAQRALR